ncbi:MAG: type III toxin-antitoxin system ToxN/AbiQ family toxin [Schaedlerella sp.]|nr:type III toxin-antitoxin system ToxN/AbiQ family toxin [Mediterraneibacter glycyrrhizinilyticus]MCB6310138.1 type III toxin-antitoxin system ToxN/AbiQ family toxin [Lachnospiraceae bacterium 210521-DFI.1.109]MCB6427550.1 type III toxin-antitoxin system ToxN/AbiQ family toxin [Mediterraneibacter glycyrrhizinilyticus]
MKFYNIKDEYINYLKKYDTKVADNKNGRFKISAFASKSI